MLVCSKLSLEMGEMGHEPPRCFAPVAAEVPLITDNSLRSAGPR